eukprot:6206127-Pleurochrysis_carterae.AAC.3
MAWADRLAAEEGMLVGPSAGAACKVACQVRAQMPPGDPCAPSTCFANKSTAAMLCSLRLDLSDRLRSLSALTYACTT